MCKAISKQAILKIFLANLKNYILKIKKHPQEENFMKTFMEEYGVIVVAAIVIMIIVVAATPLGTSIQQGITQAVAKLTTALGTTVTVAH